MSRRALFLAQDGYRWLAQPVRFSIANNAPLHFVNDTIPLRNARAGAGYRAAVTGLVRGTPRASPFAR